MSFAKRVNIDAGGGYSPPSSIAAPITAAPAAQLYYAKPSVTTMPAYAPSYQQAPAPTNWGGGGGGISQPGNMSSPAAVAPAPPPRKTQAEIEAMAEVDSTFTDQKSMYANALEKYIIDYGRQKKGLEVDAETAQKGIARNKEVGLTGLSEDFSSRGLGNSGMAIDSRDKASDQYKKQDTNVTTGLTNSVGDLNFRKSKYETENGANGTNVQAARREAYARLAAAQNLT